MDHKGGVEGGGRDPEAALIEGPSSSLILVRKWLQLLAKWSRLRTSSWNTLALEFLFFMSTARRQGIPLICLIGLGEPLDAFILLGP